MSGQWVRAHSTAIQICLALLGVLLLAYLESETADRVETGWTMLGAGGTVLGAKIWWHRHAINQWRKRTHRNGLFALIAEQHDMLRLAGLLIELLILGSGISAMATPPSVRPEVRANDQMTALCIILIGVVATYSAWYAERMAELQSAYIHAHPEE